MASLSLCSLLFAVSLSAAAAPGLPQAEQAYREGDLEAVVPALERALAGPLAPAQRIRALELLALTHSAYERNADAVEAFRRLLGEEPGWVPSATSSPKVLRLFAQAREEGAIAPAAPPAVPAPAPPRWVPAPTTEPQPTAVATSGAAAEPARPGLHRKWWFWAGMGIAAGVAGGMAYAATRPEVPAGSLGTGALQR